MSAAKNGKSPGGCGNSQPGQNVRKVCEPSYAPIIACITAAFIIELCLLWFFFSSVPVITTYVPYTVQRNDRCGILQKNLLRKKWICVSIFRSCKKKTRIVAYQKGCR